jgi:hypothetical protein
MEDPWRAVFRAWGERKVWGELEFPREHAILVLPWPGLYAGLLSPEADLEEA